jgi:superfamily II RNA helicase
VPVTLYDVLPRDEKIGNDALLGRFLEYVTRRGLSLYPAQEEAILELFEERNVILNTPTGSGKSLVASALHFKSLAQGRPSVYTCPIKALVNEKWLALCKEFGAQNVGLSTGDATINHGAPILCCTAEILANMALRDGPRCAVRDVVMDEFHYYSDRERGGAWQIPLLTLPKTRFLLMSATLGDTRFFEAELTRGNSRPTVTVSGRDRPVPLEFSYAETPLSQTVEGLVAGNQCPVYVVHFSQLEAAESAQDFTSINICTREEKAALAKALEGFKFSSPYGPEVKKWLRHGVGIHHAGLLPKYRVLVEQLAQQGLLKIICGTDTLGVGVNVPIRTVLFTRLCKFDGQKTSILTSRDFHQIAGRAGRKGFDDRGWVIAQAPEHVVENRKLEEKAARDGKKVVKRKPPEKHFVNWDQNTFTRLIGAPPEPLVSRFQVSHGMLLNVLSRPENGCEVMRTLLDQCHEGPKSKKALRTRAWQLFRALVDRKVVEFIPKTETGSYLRVNVDLQDDFSMNQTLSLYLLDTLPKLDPAAADYSLDLITLVESILEDPDVVLRKQLDRVKGEKIAELKQQGMEYEQRMEELEKLEYPKPRRDWIYETFNAFADQHPWVAGENIRPKSIAREMFEQFRSFADYVNDYELHRFEGVLLRHLNSVYKVLAQTVPDQAKTEPVRDMEVYLSAMIRQVDSSLMEEWERMQDPNYRPTIPEKELRPPGAEEAAKDITRDTKAFTAAVRHRIFLFLQCLARGEISATLQEIPSAPASEGSATPESRLTTAWTTYRNTHSRIRLDPEARNPRHTHVRLTEDKAHWQVEQVVLDPEEHNDWSVDFEVDLATSKATSEPQLKWIRFGSIGGFDSERSPDIEPPVVDG